MRGRKGWLAVAVLAIWTFVHAPTAAAKGYEPDTFEHCGGCPVAEIKQKAWTYGDGGHYFVDLDARTLRYFQVSGVDSNNRAAGKSGPVMIEAVPHPTVKRAYDNLQRLFDRDPAFFKLDTITIPSETAGMGPDLNVAGVTLDGFSPYGVGQGPFSTHFEQQWDSFIGDERRLRDAHGRFAELLYNVTALLSSVNVEFGVGKGPASLGANAGLLVNPELKVRVCNRGGDCAVVAIDKQGKWRFEGGYSKAGARYPQRSQGLNFQHAFSSTDDATDYLRDLMNGGGHVTQTDIAQLERDYSGGWIYISMVYIDGILKDVTVTYEDD